MGFIRFHVDERAFDLEAFGFSCNIAAAFFEEQALQLSRPPYGEKRRGHSGKQR